MQKLEILDNKKRYPCSVCCRYFGRDRDIFLADGFYVCESEIWDENSCGFSFPERLTKEEIEEAVEKRIRNLQRRGEGNG